jgi:hypothetical protein
MSGDDASLKHQPQPYNAGKSGERMSIMSPQPMTGYPTVAQNSVYDREWTRYEQMLSSNGIDTAFSLEWSGATDFAMDARLARHIGRTPGENRPIGSAQ